MLFFLLHVDLCEYLGNEFHYITSVKDLYFAWVIIKMNPVLLLLLEEQ